MRKKNVQWIKCLKCIKKNKYVYWIMRNKDV